MGMNGMTIDILLMIRRLGPASKLSQAFQMTMTVETAAPTT